MKQIHIDKTRRLAALLAALCVIPLHAQAKQAPRGATVPFVTYEAENASLGGGARKDVDADIKEASSGKSYVHLAATGQSVQFKNVSAADRLILRYSIPRGSSGTLTLTVNGGVRQKIPLRSTQCYDNDRPDFYVRRYDEKTVAVRIPKGGSVRLQKDRDDTCSWYGIDLIDLETAPPPLKKPADFLAITDYGADAAGIKDSRAAIEACLRDARTRHKGVWIPAGRFSISSRIDVPDGLAMQGAGYWYSCLYFPNTGLPYSDAIGFKLAGHNTVSHIQFVGNGLSRDRATILFRNIGSDVTLADCWFQNVACVYGWCDYHRNVLKNCRVYGTYFDCIHWGDGAAWGNLAVNNYFRGAGDDAVAQVNRTDYGLAHDNVAEFNTVVASYWGRGLSDVGGDSLTLRDNVISSTYNAGIMISTEPLGPAVSRPVRGLKILRNTVVYCGHTGHNHAGIHCWLFTNPMENVVIDGCLIEKGETQGIHFDKTGFGDSGGRTVIRNTVVKQNAGLPYDNQSDLIAPILTGDTMAPH